MNLSKKIDFDTKRKMGLNFMILVVMVSWFWSIPTTCALTAKQQKSRQKLRFDQNGEFKILQVADMHYANGKTTLCLDVLPSQKASCTDLNTTAFIHRMILAEKPNLIVFTGDNIYGYDSSDSAKSMNAAFAPAIESNIPWVAVLGNHDQEGSLSREGVMKYIVGLKNSLSKVNPPEVHIIDGFGNNNLEIGGVQGTVFENKSVLNLYFLDSGDYSKVPTIPGYDWIKPSQQLWFERTSAKLRKAYIKGPAPQKEAAPGLAYFHIPLPEYTSFDSSNMTGVKMETDGGDGISSASVNSGFFTTLVGAGDVKAVFVGHDHLNDFCGKLMDIQLCYAGGFGYHAYGKAGWSRRARVVVASLEKTDKGSWGAVKSIKSWKRLDDQHLTGIDGEVLWSKSTSDGVKTGSEELNHQFASSKSQMWSVK
ncbi:probable inactive purple acid phosphatase 29 isoform X2 [Medicago truncatula]|uniref:probable inactive purple acid phosphatase 29 isoform X2 n=1 Tax=Medicago truncatula TaxID=3880 RepID=UPI0019683267|nr:probable inactive purple acid phosphatase 29 isoform X2 [Medicago truncatula]